MALRFNLTVQILLGLILGLAAGVFAPSASLHLKFLSDVFLRLVQMIIAPLLVAVLVSGLSSESGADFRKVGRIALAGFIYFAVLTVVVFLLGSILALLLQPGATPVGPVHLGMAEELRTAPKPSLADVLTNIVPSSALEAMVRNDILQLIVFSLFLGVAISRAGAAGQTLARFFHELAGVMFIVTEFVMHFAPVGVFAALAYALGKEGFQVFFTLIRLVLVVYLALLMLVFGVLYAIALLFRIPFWSFLGALTTPFVLAFSTCSTMPALPRAFEDMEKLGVPKEVVSFVLPLGLRFNAVGSTLYQVVALFFLIQYYRFPLTRWDVFLLLLVLMVISKGLAPVPRASLLVLAGTLTSFSLPLDGIALILAVDQFMDMPRTGVNVLGNCLGSMVVARTMGILKPAGAG